MKTFFSSRVVLALALLTTNGVPADEKKTVVQSVNYPLHYFAGRLATDAFELNYIVDPEEDPAFWKPGDKALLAFQKADLVIRNGADYEKWMKGVSLSASKSLDTSRSFSSDFIRTEGKDHQHGNGAMHSHAGTAFTTWIDFSQASQQAGAIAARFKLLQPGSASQIDENLRALEMDLDALDSAMKSFAEKWGGRPLIASHPIYQYLARAYGLKIEALEWEPEMEIKDKDRDDLKELLMGHASQWMIWEDKPSEENIAAVAALGLKSIIFSPSANVPGKGDWLSVMKQNIANLEMLLN